MKNAGIFALLAKGTAALLFALPGTWAAAISNDGDLNNLLNQQYKKQVLAVRSPLQSSTLKFDSDGKALKSVPEARWTIHGAILVHMQKAFFKVLRFAAHWAFGRAELNPGRAHPALTDATARGMRGGVARTDSGRPAGAGLERSCSGLAPTV